MANSTAAAGWGWRSAGGNFIEALAGILGVDCLCKKTQTGDEMDRVAASRAERRKMFILWSAGIGKSIGAEGAGTRWIAAPDWFAAASSQIMIV